MDLALGFDGNGAEPVPFELVLSPAQIVRQLLRAQEQHWFDEVHFRGRGRHLR